jgi:hypothetical protein
MKVKKSNERYELCKDQPAQIDCRVSSCAYHKEGSCTNISPAITFAGNASNCLSYDKKDNLKELFKASYDAGFENCQIEGDDLEFSEWWEENKNKIKESLSDEK